ncbi:hypothetical protein EB118_25525 [bacterium]|nr:hypothetical protein [bacterium]
MEIRIDIEKIREKKVFIATPMYGGQCYGGYTKSIADFMVLCTRYKIECKLFFMFNESLITRARNYLADEFMRSDYTHLLFIDSDITFNAQDILVMLHYSEDEDKDVICGPYPKKAISWEKVKAAVDKGFADKDPLALENFTGDYVFNPVDGTERIALGEPAEVKEGGTGFMLVRRNVFERMSELYPERSYKPDHVRTKAFDGSREIMAYFDCVIDPDSKRYLSEDYMFCQYARKAGLKVWMLPWLELKHTGSYTWGGSLSALAAVGASPTASRTAPKR